MSGFGYIPIEDKNIKYSARIKDFILRFVGWPHIVRRLQAPVVMKMLDLQPTDNVLDLGCGRGEYAWEISKYANVVGVDIDKELLSRAMKATNTFATLKYIIGSVYSLPFEDNSFNKILISGTLQSVDEINLFKEANRVIKKTGCVILVVKADHILIKRFYKRKKNNGIIKNIFGLPDTYHKFENEYCKKVTMTMHYGIDEIKRLAKQQVYTIKEYMYSPGKYSSFIEDILHMLFWKNGFAFLKSKLFFIISYQFYKLMNLLSSRKKMGNYLIVKMIK